MKVLVIGGEGYIGCVLVDYLIKNNVQTSSIDSLVYNQDQINKHNNNTYYEFFKIDIRSKDIFKFDFSIYDKIIILAGLVGDPITKKYPEQSININENGIIDLIEHVSKKNKHHILFISTCSNYGLIEDDIYADENFDLNPLSLYAESKVKVENYLINNQNINFTILRFATAFGLSQRMRFDLTLNEFTKDLYLNKKLEVYDPDTWRPYCHVNDFARLILKVINSDEKLVKNQVFNAGSNKNNYTKRSVVNEIINSLNLNNDVIFLNKGKDPRNYKVDFSKVKNVLSFETNFTLQDGINEIVEYIDKNRKYENFDSIKFGNYELKNG